MISRKYHLMVSDLDGYGLVYMDKDKYGKVLCIQCDKAYGSIYIAKRHYWEKHSGANSGVECKICHKIFSNERSLGNHYRTFHNVSQSAMKQRMI